MLKWTPFLFILLVIIMSMKRTTSYPLLYHAAIPVEHALLAMWEGGNQITCNKLSTNSFYFGSFCWHKSKERKGAVTGWEMGIFLCVCDCHQHPLPPSLSYSPRPVWITPHSDPPLNCPLCCLSCSSAATICRMHGASGHLYWLSQSAWQWCIFYKSRSWDLLLQMAHEIGPKTTFCEWYFLMCLYSQMTEPIMSTGTLYCAALWRM